MIHEVPPRLVEEPTGDGAPSNTGWRNYSEVYPMTWANVDLRNRVVRLDAGTTKNREGRVFPMTSELYALLVEQRG